MMEPMIYHERQEGQLCAQHALNNLLQGPYFTAIDLAQIGQSLDVEEATAMAEGGTQTPEYLSFLAQQSQHSASSALAGNFDDTGFFSIQVIERALQVWGLKCTPMASQAFKNIAPEAIPNVSAFILNLDSHWFTLRLFGHGSANQRWYNLNSTNKRPEFVSETYLSLLLDAMRQSGYSIFVIEGTLPTCQADEYAFLNPISNDHTAPSTGRRLGGDKITIAPPSEDEQLQQAIALSIQSDSNNTREDASVEALRQKRLARFSS